MKRTPTTYDMVFLADDEWGNDTMDAVAREWFEQYPDCQFVEVHEHGGWWLGYRRDMSICGTANERGIFPKPLPRPEDFSGICQRRTPRVMPISFTESQAETIQLREAVI